MAERVGFEPTERFPVHSISSAANSTTLAPLRDCRLVSSNTSAFLTNRPIGNHQLAMTCQIAWNSKSQPTSPVTALRVPRTEHQSNISPLPDKTDLEHAQFVLKGHSA